MELNRAVALVTGGSEGIGRSIAEALKAEGAKVTITGRREDLLKKAAEEIGADFIAGDVGREADAVQTVAAVVDWRELRVPNALTLAGLAATVAVAVPLVATSMLDTRDLVLGAVLMAGPLLISHLETRGRTPGLGDDKLAGDLGLTLGAVSTSTAYVGLLASLLTGTVFGLWYQRRSGRRGLPFASAIAAATLGVLFVAGAAERGLV